MTTGLKYNACWPNQRYGPGFESGPWHEIRSDMYAIGLISRAVSEGLMVSSLICDHPAPLKLRPYGAI